MTWTEIVENELRKCTDCGLCLSSCPTFTVTHAEGDSPRGRVHLLDLALAGERPDGPWAQHLAGCIECGACHVPCPTGVQVAVARQAHRLGSGRSSPLDFERRVADLAEAIESDAGARLTIDAIGDLLRVTSDASLRGPESGGVLPLFGPMLRRARFALVDELETRLYGSHQGLIQDPALVGALERASGFFRDVGLTEEHDQAVAEVSDLVNARGYQDLTVAVFDWLMMRLREIPLPTNLRVVSAYQVFTPTAVPPARSVVWDHPANADHPLPGAPLRCEALPAWHGAAAAPVLLSAPALRVLADLIRAKRTWLAGRTLLTMDARAIVRFPGSRHLAEFLFPSHESVGAK